MTHDTLSGPHGKLKSAAAKGASTATLEGTGLKMELLDPLSDPDSWDHDVMTHRGGTVFHSAAWARVLATTYGHRPVYLRFRRGQETAALVPIMEVRSPITGRRGVCLPFSDFCGPLLFDGCERGELAAHLAQLAGERNWKYLELRGGALDVVGTPGEDGSVPTFFGHDLGLTIGAEALRAGCSSAVRRALRKAEHGPLTVRIDRSSAAMLDFFHLHNRTRRRHGLPPQPYRFFQNIHKELIHNGSGFIALADHADRTYPVAAAVFLRFGDSGVYKFGASDESGWGLRPNNLVMWEGIRHLAESGANHLHLGRTALEQEGLRRFKLSWGACEEPIHYAHYQPRAKTWQPVVLDPAVTLLSSLAHKVFGNAPLALNRLVGALVYPHLD